MPFILVVRGLELLLVLAAIAGAVDVWWQTGAFERQIAADAKRRRRLLSLSQLNPPSEAALRQAWLDGRRQQLDRLLALREAASVPDAAGRPSAPVEEGPPMGTPPKSSDGPSLSPPRACGSGRLRTPTSRFLPT